jgi:hypothetical protein
MAQCECGCSRDVSNGQFLPGHDQILRTSLEQKVGGLLPLRALVQAAQSYCDGSDTEEKFTQIVRGIFAGGRHAGPRADKR